MAMSDEWTEYHLTPRGWEEGSSRVDGAGTTTKPDPEGSVLVCRYRELWTSPYSKCEKTVDVMRTIGTKEQIAELKKKHGECPQRL